MDAQIYLLKRSYINFLKKFFRKPTAAILTVFTIGCMLATTIMRLTVMKGEARPELFHPIVGSGILLYGFFIFSAIINQNAGIFQMNDVNLMFTAPLDKKKNLVYAVINSFVGSILMSLFILMMLPMVAGPDVPLWSYIAACFSIILLMGILLLVYYYFYLLGSKEGSKIPSLKLINRVIGILIVIILGIIIVICGGDFKKAISIFFESSFYNAVPIYGWTKWAVVSALNGNILMWVTSTVLCVLFISFVIFGIIKMDHDYYEQVVTDAQRLKSMRDKAVGGRLDSQSYNTKNIRKAKGEFREGAMAIWSKQILELKKSNIGKNNMGMIIGILYVLIFSLVMEMDYKTIAIMVTVMTMTSSANESWNGDFKKPFIFLIPESSLSKAFFGTLSTLIKSILSGIPAFVLLYIFKRPPVIELLLMYAIYVSYMPIFLYSAVFAQRIAGSQSNLFMVMIIIILAVLVAISGSDSLGAVQTLVTIVVNLFLAFLLLLVSKRIFEVSELMD